jgi:hypothetical protein
MSNPYEQQPRTLEEAEDTVKIYDALERLQKTADFKTVFKDHLFTHEVIRLHSLLAHPEKSIVDSRDKIISDLDALSNIKFALQMINTIGKSVKTQLDEFREAQMEAENEAMAEQE